MSSFTAPLIVEALNSEADGRGLFRVHKSFVYEVGYLGSGDRIEVPEAFETDLGSVPWFARAFIPIAGRMAKPALLHDWLLAIGSPRAHQVFDEALEVAGFGWLARKIMGAFVRLWALRP